MSFIDEVICDSEFLTASSTLVSCYFSSLTSSFVAYSLGDDYLNIMPSPISPVPATAFGVVDARSILMLGFLEKSAPKASVV